MCVCPVIRWLWINIVFWILACTNFRLWITTALEIFISLSRIFFQLQLLHDLSHITVRISFSLFSFISLLSSVSSLLSPLLFSYFVYIFVMSSFLSFTSSLSFMLKHFVHFSSSFVSLFLYFLPFSGILFPSVLVVHAVITPCPVSEQQQKIVHLFLFIYLFACHRIFTRLDNYNHKI
jgi:hypothetical protein